MAGDWIKMRTNLDTDPAVVRIASGLKTDRYSVVGRLHKLWSWANEHLTDGQDVPVDSEFLDALLETPGFSEQLRRVGWLSGRDGNLCFPSFDRHNGASAKQRALDALRKKSARETSEKCPDANRTKTGLEKRREEKSNNTLSLACEPEKIPDQFRSSETFLRAWDQWKAHRVQMQKPMTAMEGDAQLMELMRCSNSPDDAAALVDFSRARGAKNLITSGEHRGKADPQDRPRRSNMRSKIEEWQIRD